MPFVHAGALSFDRPIAVEPLRAHVAAALAGIARYRRRIAHRRFGAADWVDDAAYRIEHHVHAASVAAPGGPRELDQLRDDLAAALDALHEAATRRLAAAPVAMPAASPERVAPAHSS